MQNDNFMNKMRGAISDSQTFFHSSFVYFDKIDFSNSDFGMHFGTKETALNRLPIKKAEMERLGYPVPDNGENPHLLEAKLNYTNPIVLNENRSGQWMPADVIRTVFEMAENGEADFITEDQIDQFYEDEVWFNDRNFHELSLDGEEYNGAHSVADKEKLWVADWLESLGFDAIEYSNEFEGGGTSILVFREEQIEIVGMEPLNPDFNRKMEHSSRPVF